MQVTNVTQALHRIAAQEISRLDTTYMIKKGKGYRLYNRYDIQPSRGVWAVYQGNNEISLFENKRLAATWCIFDAFRQYKTSQEVLLLNGQYMRVCARVEEFSRAKKSDLFEQELYGIRLSHELSEKKHLETRLDKLVSIAKYYQIRGFANETHRSGNTAGNKKYQ